MQCQYCREEIADDAVICRFCRKDTVIGKDKKSEGCFGWVLGAILLVGVGFFVLFAIGSSQPPRNTFADVKKSCEEQFGPDTDAVQKCQLSLITKSLDDQQQQKLRDAAAGAGVR